jgi:hypothetical protein
MHAYTLLTFGFIAMLFARERACDTQGQAATRGGHAMSATDARRFPGGGVGGGGGGGGHVAGSGCGGGEGENEGGEKRKLFQFS